ncbi:MAG: C-GCAxxG-C-C family protein [Thermodesulfobacteriota bacterium]
MSARDRALALFKADWLCAEAVLKAITEAHGVASPLIPRIATPLCAGLGRSGGPCGALTGALLALGVLRGRDEPDREAWLAVQSLALEFTTRFSQRFGSTTCPGLLGVDLNTPEGQKTFASQEMKQRKCREYVLGAVELVEEVLGEE